MAAQSAFTLTSVDSAGVYQLHLGEYVNSCPALGIDATTCMHVLVNTFLSVFVPCFFVFWCMCAAECDTRDIKKKEAERQTCLLATGKESIAYF